MLLLSSLEANVFWIREVTCGEFSSKIYDVKLGSKATYNHYYEITVSLANKEFKIGLQECYFGIEPQIYVANNNTLIGAGTNFYVVNLVSKEYVQIKLDAPLYCFFIENNMIVIVDEIDVICLSRVGDIIWKKEFNDIIVDNELQNGLLKVVTDDGQSIMLDVLTGKIKDIDL